MVANAVLEALVESAKDGAFRRHHRVVRAAHVIDALFLSPGMGRRVRKLGFDADHLRSIAAAALDAIPAAGGYRDGAPPDLCPSVARALARAAPRLGLYGTEEVVSVLQDAPELRSAFRPYVLDESIVLRLQREVERSDAADALHFLFQEYSDLAARVASAGLATEKLTKVRGHVWWRDPCSVAARAAKAGGYAVVEPELIVAQLVRELAPVAGYELACTGDALELLLHGPMPEHVVADDEPAEVVFVNDPVTTRNAVCGILMDHFGLSEDEALDLSRAIDAHESAVVAQSRAQVHACWRTSHAELHDETATRYASVSSLALNEVRRGGHNRPKPAPSF